jgi:predicted enzyme related to lactoylglutathione lyase
MGDDDLPHGADHTISAVGVVLDCLDPVALADFWQEAIGFAQRTGDGEPYVTLSGSSLRRPLNHLTLQKVPEPKVGKARLHLDLFAGDVDAEVARLEALGARVLSRMPDDAEGDDLLMAVMADPEGNELCVIARPRREG